MSPDAASVDRHVVIVTAAGAFNAAGEGLTGPVDAVDKLEKLIDWAHQRGGLQPLVGDGGSGAGAGLAGRRCVQSAHRLPGRVERGGRRADRSGAGAAGHPRVGTARQADGGLMLTRSQGAQRVSVEILAEPQPWLAGGSPGWPRIRPNSAAGCASGMRRWARCPPPAAPPRPRSSATTSCAAAPGGVAPSCRHQGCCPPWVQPEVRIQPAWCASAAEVEQEFERSDELVCLAQQCPQLASAGMLTLGYGQPQALDAAAAAAAAAQSKRPFGLWRVTLPPANDLTLPAMLPPPHPQMRAEEPAQAWLTSDRSSPCCVDGLGR